MQVGEANPRTRPDLQRGGLLERTKLRMRTRHCDHCVRYVVSGRVGRCLGFVMIGEDSIAGMDGRCGGSEGRRREGSL